MTKPKQIDVNRFISFEASLPEFKSLVDEVGEGALFVYPTETIYGIGGVQREDVENRIYKAKVRKPDNPLLLISSDLSHFDYLNLDVTRVAKKLAEKFWPGDLTMILSHKDDSNKKTGIRVSSHPFIKKLCDATKKPIFSTSANISGEEYRNDPDFIFETFKDSIDLMFDYGELPESSPSTVVMIEDDDNVKVLREGVIKESAIFDVLRS